jgi:hypothetical protein
MYMMTQVASMSTTPTVDALTLGSLVLYISLATTVTSLPTNTTNGAKFHRSFAQIAAFAFSIFLGIWGTMRFDKAHPYTAYSAIVIGSAFLIAGSFADKYRDVEKDGTTERFSATTSALYPALIGLTGAGIVKTIFRYNK